MHTLLHVRSKFVDVDMTVQWHMSTIDGSSSAEFESVFMRLCAACLILIHVLVWPE